MSDDRVAERSAALKEKGLEKSLAYACSAQDLELVKQRLEGVKPAELNRKASFYGTALHIACRDNRVDIAKLLLAAGIDLELKDVASDTALFVALEFGYEELAYLLMEAGADVHAKGVHRTSTLHRACMCCSRKMIEFIIEKGVSVNELASDKRSALIYTINLVSGGNIEAAKLLIERGISSEHYNAAFNEACWRANPDIARLLLEHGADPNVLMGKTGKKPETLFWICSSGSYVKPQRKRYAEVIELLQNAGFDFAKSYKFKGLMKEYEGSPLDAAVKSGFAEAVEAIRKHSDK